MSSRSGRSLFSAGGRGSAFGCENRLFVLDGRPDADEEKSLGKIPQWLCGSPLARKVHVGLKPLQENLQKVLIKHTLACMPELKSSPERTAVAAIQLRMRMRILTRPENLLAIIATKS